MRKRRLRMPMRVALHKISVFFPLIISDLSQGLWRIESQPCNCPSSAVANMRILIKHLELGTKLIIGSGVCSNFRSPHVCTWELRRHHRRLLALDDYLELSLLMLLLLLCHFMSEIMPDFNSYVLMPLLPSYLPSSRLQKSNILSHIVVFLPSSVPCYGND